MIYHLQFVIIVAHNKPCVIILAQDLVVPDKTAALIVQHLHIGEVSKRK